MGSITSIYEPPREATHADESQGAGSAIIVLILAGGVSGFLVGCGLMGLLWLVL